MMIIYYLATHVKVTLFNAQLMLDMYLDQKCSLSYQVTKEFMGTHFSIWYQRGIINRCVLISNIHIKFNSRHGYYEFLVREEGA